MAELLRRLVPLSIPAGLRQLLLGYRPRPPGPTSSAGSRPVTCPSCHEELELESAAFCPTCGTPLHARCPACGFDNPGDSRFCTSCGAPVGAARVAPPDPPTTPRPVDPRGASSPDASSQVITIVVGVVATIVAIVIIIYGFIYVTSVEAYVACESTLAGVHCTITRQSGIIGTEVCYDIDIPCSNGVRVTASDCGPIPAGVGSMASRTIPWERAKNFDACDQPVGFNVNVHPIE